MCTRSTVLAAGLMAVAIGVIAARDPLPQQVNPSQASKQAATDERREREADREAIRRTSREFAEAFAKGDAKAAAAHWTAQGEYQDDNGNVLIGRDAIEKAFSDLFKERPGCKIEVRTESIRFPSRDIAVEEGMLRQVRSGKELPSSTLYSTVHVREDGRWRIASSREWGAGQDRLEDLEWLLGTWKGSVNNQEVVLTFERDAKQTCIMGRFTSTAAGKAVSTGTTRIGMDPQRGQVRSWHFDDDGGHGQALWLRDGDNWIMDAIGVAGDGAEHASVNILSRLSDREITWRSIDRVMSDQALPNTVPIKLSRVGSG